MKEKLRNRYYKQILLTLLAISLIPVVFLGYYVVSFVEMQMQTIYKSYAAGLENEKERFETNFQYVDVALIRLGLKTQCTNAVNKPRIASNFQIFNTMQEELQLIHNTEEYLKNVYLVSSTYNWVLTSTEFQELDNHDDAEMLRMLLAFDESSFWYNDGRDLWICKRVPINASTGNGMLIARFDTQTMLRKLSGTGDGSTLFVLDKQDHIMLGPERARLIWDELEDTEKTNYIYGETNLLKMRYQNENYVLLQSESDYNGWNYVLLLPTAAADHNIFRIMLMVVLVMAGFLATTFLAIYFSSQKLYLPIDTIDNVVKKGIRHTQGDKAALPEGSGLLDRLQYVVSMNVEMNQKLEHDRNDRQQLFLRRIYQGEVTNPTREQFEQNGFVLTPSEGRTFFIMAIKYHGHFASEGDRHLYMFALDNIVCELFENEGAFPPVAIGSLMYLTCGISTESDESAVMKAQMLAMMLITTVRKYMKLPLNIGISQGITNLSELFRGAEESKKALQDAMGAEGEVRLYHNPPADEYKNSNIGKKQRLQLLHYIDMGERDTCREELRSYIRELSKLHYYLFKLEICKLVSEILSIYSDYALSPDYDKVGDIVDFDITQTVNTAERLYSYLWDYLLEPLFDVICSQAQERDMMQQVVEYVLDHLEKDVSLDECARHFNYNANYLSRWFKSKMGMTYTDFVTGKKMERCKALLLESEISVNDLAQRFGYSSAQNFIRVFKKYTLMTPGQYRKMERQKLSTSVEQAETEPQKQETEDF